MKEDKGKEKKSERRSKKGAGPAHQSGPYTPPLVWPIYGSPDQPSRHSALVCWQSPSAPRSLSPLSVPLAYSSLLFSWCDAGTRNFSCLQLTLPFLTALRPQIDHYYHPLPDRPCCSWSEDDQHWAPAPEPVVMAAAAGCWPAPLPFFLSSPSLTPFCWSFGHGNWDTQNPSMPHHLGDAL